MEVYGTAFMAFGDSKEGDCGVLFFHSAGELSPVLNRLLNVVLWMGVGEGGEGRDTEGVHAHGYVAFYTAFGTVDVRGRLKGDFRAFPSFEMVFEAMVDDEWLGEPYPF